MGEQICWPKTFFQISRNTLALLVVEKNKGHIIVEDSRAISGWRCRILSPVNHNVQTALSSGSIIHSFSKNLLHGCRAGAIKHEETLGRWQNTAGHTQRNTLSVTAYEAILESQINQ